MASDKLNSISPVDIDTGKFKYVQIRVYVEDPDSKEESSKLIVRGYSWAEWHADIYEKVQGELEAAGMETECLGGGRILHDKAQRTIQVFGYSQGYGLADHARSVELLKVHYPDYESITWSNEGY